MRARVWLELAVATGAVLAVVPVAAAAVTAVRGTAAVAFHATSTLHDFDGHAPPVPVEARRDGDGRWAAEVTVAAGALDTADEERDAKMRAMLDAGRHPTIHAAFAGLDPETLRAQHRLPFRLTIAGRSREVVAHLEGWREDAHSVSFDAAFPVSLRAFGLDAPTVLFFIRVGDEVQVRVHVELVAA